MKGAASFQSIVMLHGGDAMVKGIAISHEPVAPALPTIRRIGTTDLLDALALGFDDFRTMPTHIVFMGMIYPVIGLLLGKVAVGDDLLPLLYPLIAGFALIGPVTALGLYELSRRREQGLDTAWWHAADVLKSPQIRAIEAVGALLLMIFLGWLWVAQSLYAEIFGAAPAQSIQDFLNAVLNTPQGLELIMAGNLIGLGFAIVALAVSVVSFPLLLDRPVGATVAVLTSIRAVMVNPRPMALWGLIVAGCLIMGSVPFFIGLAVLVPILGHATWHLYRKMVQP